MESGNWFSRFWRKIFPPIHHHVHYNITPVAVSHEGSVFICSHEKITELRKDYNTGFVTLNHIGYIHV